MKLGISLLLLAVTAMAVNAQPDMGRSGYNCRRHCGYDYVPVCSTENKDYDNECMMTCDWGHKRCGGRCPCYRQPRPVYYEPMPGYYEQPSAQTDCNCGADKDYVCSYEGETYDNECEAKCDGKLVACDGRCPCT